MLYKIVSLCLLIACFAVPVRAADSQGATAATTARVSANNTLLQQLLEEESGRVTTWYRAWTVGYAALTAVQGAGYFVFHNDPGQQTEMLVGAAGSLLGVAGMLISPVPDVRRAAVEETSTTAALLHGAAAEREGRSILNHLLAAAVPIGSAALLYWVWDRPAGALLNLGAGLAIGAGQIYTQPYRLVAERRKMGFAAALVPLPSGAGLQVSLRWP